LATPGAAQDPAEASIRLTPSNTLNLTSRALHISAPDSGGYRMTLNTDERVDVRTATNTELRVRLLTGSDASGDGQVEVYDDNETLSIQLHSDSNNAAGQIAMFGADGTTETVEVVAEAGGGGSEMSLRNGLGIRTIRLDSSESTNRGSQITLYNSQGSPTIELDGDFDDTDVGRIITDVLEITGADLAERFPMSDQPQPGMVVEIDIVNPGKLRTASGAYNRRVAGVISGAGDIPTGALLGNLPGHKGSPAVALSGRVYVWCDASHGTIQPGDLLTTSNTPGHAMGVKDHGAAQGAIIGKAMTGLESGMGLVLVLVSLQ
jgi:hypothetical protein